MSTHDARRDPGWVRWLAVVGPVLLGVVQVGGSFGASHEQPERRALDAVALVLLLAGPVALLFLRRFPVPVVAVTGGATLAYLLAGYPYGPVVLSLVVSLFVNVLLGHRLVAWLVFGAVLVGHFTLAVLLLGEDWSWVPVLAVAAWGLLILVAGDVARARRERRQAARRAREEQERREANEERLRIARELHDVVAHHMSLINVQAGVALHLLDRKPEQAQTALTAIRDASHEALTELRSLVGVLRDEAESAPRAPASMLASVDDLVERTKHAGVAAAKVVHGEARPLPAAVELAAFRILQEAVTNVVRHSGAGRVRLHIGYGADVLTIRVEDDGVGAASVDPGSGIRGMRERATALGGTLTAGPAPSGGFRVEAMLPVAEPRGDAARVTREPR